MNDQEFLDSWKKISGYLGKEVRTCWRWEKQLGLPVHRIDKNSRRSKVFAYKSEIDQWLKEKATDEKRVSHRFSSKNRWAIGAILIAALLLIFSGALYLKSKSFFISAPLRSARPSIAVFPFENTNATKHEEYLSEGITKEFLRNLATANRIKPILVSSVRPISGPNLKKVCENLKADYILLGNLKNQDKTLTLNIQLLRTHDCAVIWKTSVEASLRNLGLVLSDLSHKIYGLLGINVRNEGLPVSIYTEENAFVSFDPYLKGDYLLSKIAEDNPWTLYHQGKYYSGQCSKEGNDLAIRLFSEAAEIDPNFALAYIGLAQCYANYVNLNWDFDKRWLTKAEDLLQNSLKMGPSPPEYYSTLIEVHLLKYVCFDENSKNVLFKQAEEGMSKYPNDPQLNSIVGYLYFLQFGGEGNEAAFKKALEYKEKSFWSDPYNTNNIVFTELLMLNKDFSRATDVCDMIIDADKSLMTKFRLGEIFYYSGDLDKAEQIFRQFDSPLDFRIGALLYLGMIASQRGNVENANKIINEVGLLSLKEYRLFSKDLKLASIYMGLGERKLAFVHLKSFFESSKAQKMRHVYYRYFEIDGNFHNLSIDELKY